MLTPNLNGFMRTSAIGAGSHVRQPSHRAMIAQAVRSLSQDIGRDVDGRCRRRYRNAMLRHSSEATPGVDHESSGWSIWRMGLDSRRRARGPEPQGSPHAAMPRSRAAPRAFGAHGTRACLTLALGEHSEPEPDIAVVAGQRSHLAALHDPSRGATRLVEVGEPPPRSSLQGALYAQAGPREYWIVNLVDHTLEVHRDPQPSATADPWMYRSVEVLRPPATVTPQAAPDAQIPVAQLLP